MSDKKLEFELTRRRALGALATIGAGSAAAGAGTFAAFSDTETSQTKRVTAGTLDLELNPGTSQSTSFQPTDIAPGDSGYVVCALNNTGSLGGDLTFNVGTDADPFDTSSLADDAEYVDGGSNPEPEPLPGDDDDGGELDTETNAELLVEDDESAASAGTSTGSYSGSQTTSLVSGSGADLPGSYTQGTLDAGETDYLVFTYDLPESVGNQVMSDTFAFDVEVVLNQPTSS